MNNIRAELRTGHYLNVGMWIDGGLWSLNPAQVLAALALAGARVAIANGTEQYNIVDKGDGSEPTFVAALVHGIPPRELALLAQALQQDAIAQLSNGFGNLEGPNTAPYGDKFNPLYFIDLAGRPALARLEKL